MKTANSLSGGRTSSYLAVHFPADYELFSMVCIEDQNAAGGWLKRRPHLLKYANEKLERFIPQYGEFKATAEDPVTIQTMMDLEQKLGREIIWVRDQSFENLIKSKNNFLPNKRMRFCTTELKLKPIFEYCYTHLPLKVKMRLGYRFDEMERKEKATTKFSFPYQCSLEGKRRQKHKTIDWRICDFPLIDEEPTIHPQIINYWKNNTDVVFPSDSNCQFCFWKDPQQKLINFKNNPAIMYWAAIQEEIIGNTLSDNISLLQNASISEQLDFFGGTGSGCTSGMCTD